MLLCQGRVLTRRARSAEWKQATAPFWEGVKDIMVPTGFFTAPVRSLIFGLCNGFDSTLSRLDVL
jgi:hypothetical protein